SSGREPWGSTAGDRRGRRSRGMSGAGTISVTVGDLKRLLASPAIDALLSGSDLFVLALALSRHPEGLPLALRAGIGVLHEHGLPREIRAGWLARFIREDTAKDRAFIAYDESSFVVDWRVGLSRRLGIVVCAPKVRAAMGLAPLSDRPPSRASSPK